MRTMRTKLTKYEMPTRTQSNPTSDHCLQVQRREMRRARFLAVGETSDFPVRSARTKACKPRRLDSGRPMIIHYELPDDLHRALKVRAAQEGITLKELIIRLLTAGLEDSDSR